MFRVEISEMLIRDCWKALKENTMGYRKEFNGSREQQCVGLVSENCIRLGVGLEMNLLTDGCDDGFDLMVGTVTCDIKSVGRTSYPRLEYANNVAAQQLERKCQAYIFSTLNKPERVLAICGWLPKWEFKERASFFRKGESRPRSDGSSMIVKNDIYEVLNSQLYPLDSFEQIKTDIGILSVS